MAAHTLRERFRQQMVVRGLADRTQRSYLLNVKLLVRRTGKHPAQLSSEDLREYFVRLVDEYEVSPSTFRQNLCAVNLFFKTVLDREEQFFVEARPKKRQHLPVILTIEETRRWLGALHVDRIRTAATVAYSCGLRSSELVSLSVPWIRANAGVLHVHNAKGGVDRIVPLPERTLELLREHWRRDHPTGKLLFESPQRETHRGQALRADTIRTALKAAAKEVGINHRVYLHTLRHCYASHLLERGVPLPLIQRWLGHKNITTTQKYAHITPACLERAHAVLHELTAVL